MTNTPAHPPTHQPGRVAHAPAWRRRTRLLWITGGVIVLGIAAWAVIATQQPRHDDRVQTKSGGMAGMQGMAGMDMPANGSITLTAVQFRQFGVTFGTVDVRPLTTDLRLPGIVAVNEEKIAQVAPKFGGYVEHLAVNFTGQSVRRGQALLDIYSPDLVAAQHELLVSSQLQQDIGTGAVPGVPGSSMNLVDAAKRRLQLWDISEQQIDALLRTRQVRRTLTLYAPVSGVVIEKKVVQGQATMPGDALYTIADLSTVWVDVNVREVDAANVRVGSTATIALASFPGRSLPGRVEYVYPLLQQDARTITARIAVANMDGRLKPGMYAVVHLITPSQSTLTVPTSAVLQTGDRNVVFVDMGHGALMPHDVEVGRVADEYTEVLSGLEPGQRVVTSAQFLLDAESNLGDVMKMMMSQMGAADMDKNMGNMQDMPGMNHGTPSGGAMPGMDMPKTGTAGPPGSKHMPDMSIPPTPR